MKTIIMVIALFLGMQSFASETVKGIQKDYETFKKEMSARVDSIDKKIEELKTQAGKKGHSVKKETVKEYESNRDELRTEINKIEEGSKANWKKVKKHISESAESLNAKLQESLKD